MGLTSSLFTALSGLTTNATLLSVAGNNIANVNTTGFKASRLTFETQILQNLSPAAAPNGNLGGSNPAQIGLGAREGAITRDFSNGSLQLTGVNTDLAVEGSGFFVVNVGGVQRYTRAGAFTLDNDFNLVNPDGGLVQGFGVDKDFKVIEGVLGNITIPKGIMKLAEATEKVRFTGNINPDGDVATLGTVLTSFPLYTDATQTTPATATDTLISLFNNTGTALFSTGDVITITGATKGGATLPDKTFEIGAANTTGSDSFGTTLGDFTTFLDEVYGIDSSVDPTAGITISAAGEMVLTGNTGTVNALGLSAGNVVVNQATAPTLPFDFSETQVANGESVRTSFVAFDSLGAAMTIDLSIVLETKDSTGTLWRFYVQSEDDSRLDRVLGDGTITFDTSGQFTSATGKTFSIDRSGTGAVPIQPIAISFLSPEGAITALVDTPSVVNTLSQDGSPLGSLVDFSIGTDGTINGVFSNGLLRSIGRVVLAQFANPAGLQELGANLFSLTPNSGDAQIVTAGSSGSGIINGGTLELSNVELSNEFISLISATTGFSASSRVLTTSDRMIQELINAVR